MKKTVKAKIDDNPLSDILDEATFFKLKEKHLLSRVGVRNHYIKKIFDEQRAAGKSMEESVSVAHSRFPHLKTDTVKKIVYGKW